MSSYVKVEKRALFLQVKSAIDRFDPFVFCPGEDAPSDEYDGESKRIAEKIQPGMSKDDMETIIAEEFTKSFGTTFTKKDCDSPACEIYTYVERLYGPLKISDTLTGKTRGEGL